MAAAGLEYGPVFRGLAGVWRRGDEVFAEARLGEEAEADAGLFGLHPGLLDAVLHALGPGGLVDGSAGPVLPFSWSGVSLHAAGASVLRARLVAAGPDGVSVVAADGAGGLVVSVRRLVLRPVPAGGLAGPGVSTGAGLFVQDWSPVPAGSQAGTCGGWAVVGDAAGQLAGVLGADRYPGLAELDAAVAAGAAVPEMVAVLVAGPSGISGLVPGDAAGV